MSSAYYSSSPDRPLFGETPSRDWISFGIVAGLSTIIVLATFAGMFILKSYDGAHIFLNICLFLLLASHLCLAFWYRAGDLEPRFLKMLYFNTTVIVLFCICTYLIISKSTDNSSSGTSCPVNSTTVKPK